MKKNYSLSTLALFLTLAGALVASCSPGKVVGSGNVVEEQREVSDFDEVHLNGIGNLRIKMGDEEGLRISAEDNLLPHIKAEVSGNKLTIGFKWGINPKPTEPIDYYVTVKELEEVSVSGVGTIEADRLSAEGLSVTLNGAAKANIGHIAAESLEVNIRGSGEVAVESVRAESLNANIIGSGSISIEGGEVEEQDIEIAGSGEYNAEHMESAETDVRIAGSGAVVVRVSDNLKTEIAGSGSVKYVGKPEVDLNVAGSGTVKRIEG